MCEGEREKERKREKKAHVFVMSCVYAFVFGVLMNFKFNIFDIVHVGVVCVLPAVASHAQDRLEIISHVRLKSLMLDAFSLFFAFCLHGTVESAVWLGGACMTQSRHSYYTESDKCC